MRNLALAYPDMTDAEREMLAAKMWENLGRTFGESFHLEKIASDGRVDFQVLRSVGRSRAAARAWCADCTSATGSSSPTRASAWASRSPAFFSGSATPYVDAETHKMRAFLYEGGLLPKTPVTARRLLKAAKSGGYPAFLADLRDDRGASVPFFGHPAR